MDISVNSSPSLSQSTRKSVCQPGNTLIGKEDDGGGNLLDDLGVLGDHGGRQGVELLSVSEDDDLVGLPVLGGGGGLESWPWCASGKNEYEGGSQAALENALGDGLVLVLATASSLDDGVEEALLAEAAEEGLISELACGGTSILCS